MVKVRLIMLLALAPLAAWASQDPTAPLGWEQPKQDTTQTKVVSKPVPSLQSIVCLDEDECRAIVSGKVVLVGESVSGYQVSRIEPEVVTLSRGGKQWKLKLFALDVKQ